MGRAGLNACAALDAFVDIRCRRLIVDQFEHFSRAYVDALARAYAFIVVYLDCDSERFALILLDCHYLMDDRAPLFPFAKVNVRLSC